MSEWTPTDYDVESMFIVGWCCDTNPETARTEPSSAWSRWLAAHDRALREQTAQKIEKYAVDSGDLDGPEFFVALGIAADIARGKDQTEE